MVLTTMFFFIILLNITALIYLKRVNLTSFLKILHERIAQRPAH